MPEPKDWQVGDVIQIVTPNHNTFPGCMLIVTKRDTWGVWGYIQLPDKEKTSLWIRWNEGVRIGKIVSEAVNKEPPDA